MFTSLTPRARPQNNSANLRHQVLAVGTDYGMRYSVDGTIETPDGRSPGVRTVWQVDTGDGRPRLVTAYPLQEAR